MLYPWCMKKVSVKVILIWISPISSGLKGLAVQPSEHSLLAVNNQWNGIGDIYTLHLAFFLNMHILAKASVKCMSVGIRVQGLL